MATEPTIRIDELQRDALLPQIDSFVRASPDAIAHQAYEALRAALTALEVPDSAAALLGTIVEVLLTSGRARALYGPGSERSLWSLFQKTPRGRELLASIEALNQAFKPLEGARLEKIAAAARGPGAYALTLRTDRLQMVLRFEAAGVRVESVELGSD